MTIAAPIMNRKEIVEFIDTSTNAKRRKKAFRIGEHLLVSYVGIKDEDKYQIFKRINGEPLFPITFSSHSDAIQFAEWIDDVYKEYMELWIEYPQADIFNLAKLGVKNGIRIYETIRLLKEEEKLINLQMVANIFNKATRG